MTRSVRLTLAGAGSARAAATSSAATRPLGLARIRGGGRLLQEAGLDLVLDLDEVLGLRLEVAGVRPLELRLQHPADPPIGVAKMIVDGRILGLELDRM